MSELVVVDLDRSLAVTAAAEGVTQQAERHAVLRLALEILAPADRTVVLLRTREGMSFNQIGEQLGIKASAADTRFRRATCKLQAMIESIEAGQISSCIDAASESEGEARDAEGST